MEELIQKYKEILKSLGLDKGPCLTDENGNILLFGKRWILMDVNAFPEYMIKSTANIMGERMAREFIYWFGFAYGDKVMERYLAMGIPEEQAPYVVAAVTSVVTGWGTPEILEYNINTGRLVVQIHNDFETESAKLNNSQPTNNFMRGVLAGGMARIFGSKVLATANFSNGITTIVVEKR